MISTSSHVRPLNVMGIDITPFESYAQALQCVEGSIATGRKSFWVAINPQKMYRAWKDPQLRKALHSADVGICDGVGVSIAAKILSGLTIRRCTGCDLFFEIVGVAATKGWKVFLLGASPQSNKHAFAELRQRYPRLQIVGRRDGYFKNHQEVVQQINESGAEILFVAMGSPRQETWIARYMSSLDASFFMGVGGTLDVVSGISRRAPRVFRKTGLEFFYQLLTQPWRWRRQIVYIPFMLKVLKKKLLG